MPMVAMMSVQCLLSRLRREILEQGKDRRLTTVASLEIRRRVGEKRMEGSEEVEKVSVDVRHHCLCA